MTLSDSDAVAVQDTVILDLTVDKHTYRIVLPHAGTDYIQKKLVTERVPYEQEMLEDIRMRVRPGGLVVDVGANIGNHTLFLASVAGCRVESFEPNPALCAALRDSVALNGLSEAVHVHELGLGREAAQARFGVDTPANLGGQHLTLGEGELRVAALDSFDFPEPAQLIKIDVEGMELDVLEGARGLLQRDRPLLYIECGTEAHYRRTSRWLEALNYTYWETFNATPTHLFIPAERITLEQRLQHLQAKSAQTDYKSNQLLREIRLRMTQALDREREARTALAALRAQEQQARDALAAAQEKHRETLAAAQEKQREALTAAQEKQREALAALAATQARESEARQALTAAASRAQSLEHQLTQQEDEAREAQARLRRDIEALGDDLQRAKAEQEALSSKLRAHTAESRLALDKAKLSVAKLTRTVEVRDVRLAATERREAALNERLERIRAGAAFQVGQALVAAGKSPRGLARLPAALAQIYRSVRTRRQDRAARADLEAPFDRQLPNAAPAPTPAARGEKVRGEARPKLQGPGTNPARLHPQGGSLKALRVAGIMDEFTFHSFAPECMLQPLRVDGWEHQLDEFRPDLIFIESAWQGAEGGWATKISNPSNELAGVITWARDRGIPTAFWNKEDPVHFGVFLHVAKAVDYVFTTDIDCIARYKREVGHDRAYLLPFAAQPAMHNPIERFPREDAFCFAGSYYLKYPERQRDFQSLIDVVKDMRPVEIFDRNFGRAHPHYEFPAEYQPYIVGSLPFDQIDKAYKGYRFGINMNTIKQSQTMFARRVFELMASNTAVVSNFSRGVRLMFGDLVVASDAPAELRRRLRPLMDDLTFRKFRLAALRKVMSQHTYAHRLAYVAEKMGGPRLAERPAALCAVAFPVDAKQAHALVDTWRLQTLGHGSLCLIGSTIPPEVCTDGVVGVSAVEQLKEVPAYIDAEWIAPLSASDYYGPNYLLDLHQATAYCSAPSVGKAAHFRLAQQAPEASLERVNPELAYRTVDSLLARCSLLRRADYEALSIFDGPSLEAANLQREGLVAIDEFNYALGARSSLPMTLHAVVDDLPGIRTGLDTAAELLPLAERIQPAMQSDADAQSALLAGLSADALAEAMPSSAKAQVLDGEVLLSVAVPDGKHRYVYLDRVYTRAELNLERNSRFQLACAHDDALEVRTVFEFLDENKQKISHAMNKAGDAFSLPIPARCCFVRFGLRFVGRGNLRIQRLVLADVRERPTILVAAAKNLVVLKQYPDYDDLYKYGFVHSRLRAYAQEQVAVDVFRLAGEEPYSSREFENIDVTTGDRDLLDLALQSGQYRHVLIHLMDRSIWEVVRRHLDKVKVTVWVHGAEIQVWQRREFEFERMDATEIERQKKLSDQRVAFWTDVLSEPHTNLKLVFVSQHFAQETVSDLGLDLARIPHEIIHNYIDSSVFPYVEKAPEHRHRILSIRPFASRKYANDLSVQAIVSLAHEPWFKDLHFTIVGDGELFDEVTQPLARFSNVKLLKRFLNQAEIASMHRDHGVFLCPTRMDAQGVSRDEAMSSGLVPVTSRVAAVPEFVDVKCGFLAEPEDSSKLADAIRVLHGEPDAFMSMSKAAAARVQSQSGFEQTIRREISLIDD